MPMDELPKVSCLPYFQYRKADDMTALFASLQSFLQSYKSLVDGFCLGDYNQCNIQRALLNYILTCIYNVNPASFLMKNRKLPPAPWDNEVIGSGDIASLAIDVISIDGFLAAEPSSGGNNTPPPAPDIKKLTISDDILRRITTWLYYRDYKVNTPYDSSSPDAHGASTNGEYEFTIQWLKRRVARFLTGSGNNAENVSIQFDSTGRGLVILSWGIGTAESILALSALINSPTLNLPAYYNYQYGGLLSDPLLQFHDGKALSEQLDKMYFLLTGHYPSAPK